MRQELARLAELVGLCGLVIAQPVFEILQSAPEELVLRGAGPVDLVLLTLALLLGPPLVLWLGEVLVELVSSPARSVVHAVVLGGLTGLLALELVKRSTGPRSGVLVAVAVVVAVLVTVAVLRWEWPRLLARYLVFAPVLFAAGFLLFSPLADVVVGGDADAAEVEVGRPAPVVLIVLDELPTISLLDGQGRMDADLYPNLAGLAADSTWFRNHTTVAPLTPSAVPAIFTGQDPHELFPAPVSGAFPQSLFTLLGGTYDVRAIETLTRVCPSSICADRNEPSTPSTLRSLLSLSREVFGSVASPRAERQELTFDVSHPPGDPDPPQRVPDLVGGLGRDSDRPTLDVLHVLLPHQPFDFLPSGARYEAPDPPEGTYLGWVSQFTADAGRLRHALQLQLTDRLVGDILDRLRELGTYDESLVVVTADHGIAFTGEEPLRGLSEGNAPEILWTPLLVKGPGQERAEVDDRPAETIDIVPTIADVLDVEIPWDVDGRSLFAGEDGDRPARMLDWEFNALQPSEGDFVHVDRAAGFDRLIEGAGPGAGAAEPYPLHRIGRHGDLVAVPVEDVTVGPPADLRLRFTSPPTAVYDPATGSAPAYVSGEVDGSRDDWVVVAVNGVLGGIGRLHERGPDASVFWAVVPEELLREGENELEAYLVAGPAERPTLHRMEPDAPG